ncbi:hypothetical protein AAG906_012981 [Vitis piasezkii]
MSNFFPLTKRIFVNMGGDPPSFVSLAPSAPRVPCFVSRSVGMDGVKTLEVPHPQHDAQCVAFQATRSGEVMRAFISHHPVGIEEMRSKLEQVEVDLEKGAIRAKADRLKVEGEAIEAKYKGWSRITPVEERGG